MSFIETSALDNTNVDLAFTNILKDVYTVYNKFKKENENNGSDAGSNSDKRRSQQDSAKVKLVEPVKLKDHEPNKTGCC